MFLFLVHARDFHPLILEATARMRMTVRMVRRTVNVSVIEVTVPRRVRRTRLVNLDLVDAWTIDAKLIGSTDLKDAVASSTPLSPIVPNQGDVRMT